MPIKQISKQIKKICKAILEGRTPFLPGAIKEGGSLNAKIGAAKELQGALSRLLVIVERYPQLQASQNFMKLQDELAGTENRIAVARTRYNRSVQAFNTFIREVFGSFFASRKGLNKSRPYFEIEEGVKEVPKVEF